MTWKGIMAAVPTNVYTVLILRCHGVANPRVCFEVAQAGSGFVSVPKGTLCTSVA